MPIPRPDILFDAVLEGRAGKQPKVDLISPGI
jgi:hypothetical protein